VTIEVVLNSLHKSKDQNKLDYYMIGDSLISDIKGGNENGFKTILVTTGNYKPDESL
jgi:ribonucleotide monophosphatase NagD (HAD superfamily)